MKTKLARQYDLFSLNILNQEIMVIVWCIAQLKLSQHP